MLSMRKQYSRAIATTLFKRCNICGYISSLSYKQQLFLGHLGYNFFILFHVKIHFFGCVLTHRYASSRLSSVEVTSLRQATMDTMTTAVYSTSTFSQRVVCWKLIRVSARKARVISMILRKRRQVGRGGERGGVWNNAIVSPKGPLPFRSTTKQERPM